MVINLSLTNKSFIKIWILTIEIRKLTWIVIVMLKKKRKRDLIVKKGKTKMNIKIFRSRCNIKLKTKMFKTINQKSF